MNGELMTDLVGAGALGIGATAVMDGWALFQKRVFGVPPLDYRYVGRWIGHFPRGRFSHQAIGKAQAVPGEVLLGWLFHYLTGIAFAVLLLLIWPDWLRQPTPAPALLIGIGSIVAPFLILQPGMGAGIAACRTPQPWLSRFRSLVAHTSFAVGLYVFGLLCSLAMTGQPPQG